jgi:hypothetical protein
LLKGALLGNWGTFSARNPQRGHFIRYVSTTTVVEYSKHGRSRTSRSLISWILLAGSADRTRSKSIEAPLSSASPTASAFSPPHRFPSHTPGIRAIPGLLSSLAPSCPQTSARVKPVDFLLRAGFLNDFLAGMHAMIAQFGQYCRVSLSRQDRIYNR